MSEPQDFWRKCSSCKKPIGFKQKYYVCSVSTCNGQRTGYVFCRVECWDAHVPGANHRSSAAVEKVSPAKDEFERTQKTSSVAEPVRDPVRRIVTGTTPQSSSFTGGSARRDSAPREVLIVASKLKDYIRAKSEMNTSANVMDILSDRVRLLCDRAIENARADGRKTVMDKDFR